METPEAGEHPFNRPLLAEALEALGAGGHREVIIAPLFLSPGRHAGPDGDLAEILREAEARRPGLRGHFTALIGSHPLAVATLGRTLRAALHSSVHP